MQSLKPAFSHGKVTQNRQRKIIRLQQSFAFKNVERLNTLCCPETKDRPRRRTGKIRKDFS